HNCITVGKPEARVCIPNDARQYNFRIAIIAYFSQAKSIDHYKSIPVRILALLLFLTLLASCRETDDDAPRFSAAMSRAALHDSRRVALPNGWALSPVGKSLPLGDLPLNMLVSADGSRMA